MGCTPSTIQLFLDCKTKFITSPILIRYDSSKTTFLKIDWSTVGMGYVLMQPDEYPISLMAIKHLATTEDYLFDFSLDKLRL